MLSGSVNDTEMVPGATIEGAISQIGVLDDRFAAISMGYRQRLLGAYTSVDGRSSGAITLPQDTVSVYIDGGEIIAVTHDVAEGLTTIQTSNDGITWRPFSAFSKPPPSYLDKGASGMALTIPADPADDIEADSVIGYSRDGSGWRWQTLSAAFGGERGTWEVAIPVVGKEIVIALSQKSAVLNELSTSGRLPPTSLLGQWFVAQLD